MSSRLVINAQEFAAHRLKSGQDFGSLIDDLEMQFGEQGDWDFVRLSKGDYETIEIVYDDSRPNSLIAKWRKTQ